MKNILIIIFLLTSSAAFAVTNGTYHCKGEDGDAFKFELSTEYMVWFEEQNSDWIMESLLTWDPHNQSTWIPFIDNDADETEREDEKDRYKVKKTNEILEIVFEETVISQNHKAIVKGTFKKAQDSEKYLYIMTTHEGTIHGEKAKDMVESLEKSEKEGHLKSLQETDTKLTERNVFICEPVAEK